MYCKINPQRIERFPKKGGDFAPLGPQDCPRAIFQASGGHCTLYAHSLTISREIFCLCDNNAMSTQSSNSLQKWVVIIVAAPCTVGSSSCTPQSWCLLQWSSPAKPSRCHIFESKTHVRAGPQDSRCNIFEERNSCSCETPGLKMSNIWGAKLTYFTFSTYLRSETHPNMLVRNTGCSTENDNRTCRLRHQVRIHLLVVFVFVFVFVSGSLHVITDHWSGLDAETAE